MESDATRVESRGRRRPSIDALPSFAESIICTSSSMIESLSPELQRLIYEH
jgi:hypothetical protein